ncbi:MAG TPA: tryptophan synthase subunit alpha, partial [Verrucomicrobiae bacterium]|nr:tryptophan synthase subunit alpha [Verrucomicrobiae bacterium]
SQVAKVRKAGSLPVGVGFGISTPEQAAWIAGFADAAVVGSALVERIEHAKSNPEKVKKAGAFVAQLKKAMRQVHKSK